MAGDQSVAPLYVGPRNVEHVIGHSWRWTRTTAKRLGVSVLQVGGKPLIRVSELQAAIERESRRAAPAAVPAPPVTDDDEQAAMVARLGLRRRAS